jgi:hypothetical protein
MTVPRVLIIVGLLMEGAYAGFYLATDPLADMAAFLIVNSVCYLLLAFALWWIERKNPPGENGSAPSLPIVIGFALVFRLTLMFHDPVGSDDIYRYLWDGKVGAAGMNPFALSPLDPALDHLHTKDLPGRVNFPEMRTIYPPLAQVFFRSSVTLFGDSVVGMKFLLVCADLATILLILLFTKKPGLRAESVLLYAWSPLPVLYIALDGHIDGLGIPLMLLFLFFVSTRKELRAGVALGLASLAKLYPLILAPFLWRNARSRLRFGITMIPFLLLAGGYWFYTEETGGIYESLVVYNTEFSFNGPVFATARALLGPAGSARLACAALFAVWTATLFLMKRPLGESALLAFLGFLILSPTVHPWYFCWLAALLVLRWSLSVFVLLGLTNLSNVVVYEYLATGVWREQPVLLVLEYVPFLFVFGWELWKGGMLRGSSSEATG